MALLPLLDPATHAQVFCGGILSPYRLNHPEGVCVDTRDGALWCGGEAGELYRVAPDGSSVETIACTEGFILGVTQASNGTLYLCDLQHQCIWIYNTSGERLGKLVGKDGDKSLQIPNYCVLSQDERYLFVSDTRRKGGPGIWRFELADGTSTLWMREPCFSANGMALAPDGASLYLVESHLPGVSRIPICADGSAGKKTCCIHLPGDEPDGLAFNRQGELFISIYNPSRIYRYQIATQKLELLIVDTTTDYLHHATNIAFRSDQELFAANLGAWHLTRIDLKTLYP